MAKDGEEERIKTSERQNYISKHDRHTFVYVQISF